MLSAPLVIILMAVIGLVVPSLAQKDPNPTPLKCDTTLWSHIYKPNRLQVKNKCISGVTGVVTAVRGERDGDYHILITPDRKYSNLTNDANVRLQKGELVLEPICAKKPILTLGARQACGNFTQDYLYIPYVGQRIAVTGSYVLDHDHSNWAEIHPITSLSVISSPPSSPPRPMIPPTTPPPPLETDSGESP